MWGHPGWDRGCPVNYVHPCRTEVTTDTLVPSLEFPPLSGPVRAIPRIQTFSRNLCNLRSRVPATLTMTPSFLRPVVEGPNVDSLDSGTLVSTDDTDVGRSDPGPECESLSTSPGGTEDPDSLPLNLTKPPTSRDSYTPRRYVVSVPPRRVVKGVRDGGLVSLPLFRLYSHEGPRANGSFGTRATIVPPNCTRSP